MTPRRYSPQASNNGFTLIELLVAMIVTAIVGIAMVSNSISQQRSSTMVRQVAQLQQQLRGAVYLMEEDIRIAGYMGETGAATVTSPFGVTDVRSYSITDENTTPTMTGAPLGSPSMTLAYDWDPNNAATTGNGILDEPTVSYRLFDDNNDNLIDLTRDTNGQRQLMAEGLQAIGFAYAIDVDGDGQLDRTAGNNNIIWAVDSNNDNTLDTNLDTNDDGVIDINDDANANFVIESADGGAGIINPPATLLQIRMVRIWMVARTRTADPQYTNIEQYVVGAHVVPAQAGGFQDNFRRQIIDHSVQFRYLGL